MAKTAKTEAAASPETPAAETRTELTIPVEIEPLAKSAADDILSAHIITEGIARLIQVEAADEDYSPGQVEALQAAYASMQKFEGLEASELGTPEDTAEAAAEMAEAEDDDEAEGDTIVIAAAAKSGDLRKAGARNAAKDQQVLDNILAEVIFLGAQMPGDAPEAPAPAPAPAAPAAAPSIADQPVAKVATVSPEALVDSLITRFTANAPFAKASDVQALKDELLGALGPVQEQLSKIAAQPASGGPLRYAIDPRGLATPSPEANNAVGEALTKAAAAASDPVVKEHLGRLAAAQDIAEAFKAR